VTVAPGDGGTTVVEVSPEKPSWAAARPVRTVIRFADGVVVQTEVVTPEPWSFGDVACPD